MKVIDTNPLLRLVLKDNLAQHNSVVKLLQTEEVLIIAQVIFEMEYVLRKVYEIPKKEICGCFYKLLITKGVVVEEKLILMEAIKLFEKESVDLVDAYLWVRAKELGTTVFTFDKDFKKLS